MPSATTTKATGGVHHAAIPTDKPAAKLIAEERLLSTAAIISVTANTDHALESQRWLATTAVSPSVTKARKANAANAAASWFFSLDTSQNTHAVRIAISNTT